MLDTINATAKLIAAPTEPKASGAIPRNQLSGVLGSMLVPGKKNHPLYQKIYRSVDPIPQSIPEVAPVRLTFFEKIPIIIAGKIEEAARPNARATTWAAKPGGLRPK